MDKTFLNFLRDKSEVSLRYDPQTEAVWAYGNPEKCPCLHVSLLEQLYEVQIGLIDYFKQHNMRPKTPVKFLIYASQIPEVYSYGGDLEAIIEVVKQKKHDKIASCANLAIKSMYLNAKNLDLPIQTITLVEGAAMGGGFEAALSCGAIIAEEQSTFGLQQMRFNMLPGSGIYSLLARKVGMKNADDIIINGKIYNAEEMRKMGAVTQVAPKGEGVKAVNKYIKTYRRSFNAMQALHKAKLRYHPFDFSELEYMASLWVDTIMEMDESDLKMLQKINDSQKQQIYEIPYRLRTKQDRRVMQWDGRTPLVDADGNLIEEDRRKNPDPRTQK